MTIKLHTLASDRSRPMLTKEEKSWLRKMQNLLNKCPDRFGFYTVGDPDIGVYDRHKEVAINELYELGGCEYAGAVDDAEAYIGDLKFTSHVHSTAG